MLDVGPRGAAVLSTTCKLGRQVYSNSAPVELACLEFRTGRRVINSSDGPRRQAERIRRLADATALSRWEMHEVLCRPSLGGIGLFECHGTIVMMSRSEDSTSGIIRVRRLGCPLRNIPSQEKEWPFPPHMCSSHVVVESVVMDPEENRGLLVTSDRTGEGNM